MSKFDSIILGDKCCFIEVVCFYNVWNESDYLNCLARSGFLYYPEPITVGKDRIIVPDTAEELLDITRLLADFNRCGIDYVTTGL